MSDVHQSPLWAEYMRRLGWRAEKLKSGFAYVRKLSFFGSIIKIPRLAKVDFVEIDRLAKKQKALFVKIETEATLENKKLAQDFSKNSFQEDSWSLQPTKTIVLDLTKGEEEILMAMEKDTRYSIRAATKRGVKVEKSADIDIFWTLHAETSKRGKFWAVKKDVYTLWEVFKEKGQATILMAEFNKEVLAAAFLIFYEKTAYYYHAGSTDSHRDLYPTYLIVWKSIQEAKRRGCEKLDLMGIEDKRIKSTRSWSGFSHFKKGFGGSEKTYLGSFVKYYNPFLKILFFLNRFF